MNYFSPTGTYVRKSSAIFSVSTACVLPFIDDYWANSLVTKLAGCANWATTKILGTSWSSISASHHVGGAKLAEHNKWSIPIFIPKQLMLMSISYRCSLKAVDFD